LSFLRTTFKRVGLHYIAFSGSTELKAKAVASLAQSRVAETPGTVTNLASEIIKTLDQEHLTVRAAQQRTGVAAADFSRIRNADLSRFTVDRLMSIMARLGARVEVRVKVRRPKGRVMPETKLH